MALLKFALPSTTKQWISAVCATAISGFASGVILIIADPATFNLQQGWHALWTTSLVFAMCQVALYLKQHPLPDAPAPKD